ncbi:MAG TPA: DUF447 domain-containing protein [Patescibacteria group bacterium]|nr:DUF447 domain-containing protein [Patescibacteria group bacterium]
MRIGVGDGLTKLGFTEGIVEVILTTVNSDGSPNAAPMGVRMTESEVLEVSPYKFSATYRNLVSDPRGCVNVSSDPGVFLVTAFKDEAFPGFKEPRFDGLRLMPSDAHIPVERLSSEDISYLRAAFKLKVSEVEVSRPLPRVFSRGRTEAIEAVIHATRIEAFTAEGRTDEVETLIRLFRESRDIVLRVSSPDSTEVKVVKELERLIEGWGELSSRSR